MKRALIGTLLGLAVFSTASLADEEKTENKASTQRTEQNDEAGQDRAAKKKLIHRQGHHHVIEHRWVPDEPAKPPKKPLHDHRESK